MMTVLTILKFIGLVLLWILIIFLAVGIVLLICPLGYSLKAKCMGIDCKASVNYLFHIIYATVSYKDKLEIKLRLFGIPVNVQKLLNKKQSSTDSKNVSESAESIENRLDSDCDNTPSNDTSTDRGITKASDESGEKNVIEEEPTKQKPAKQKPGKKINPRAIYDVLMKDNTRAAFLVVKKRMGKLFRAILPHKFMLKVTYGLNNPAYTGFVLGLYEMFIFYLGRSIELNPVFDDTAFEFDLKLKGRIIPIVMLTQLIAVVLNKNCRRFISDIRRSV